MLTVLPPVGQAERAGVSLNQCLLAIVAAHARSQAETERYFAAGAARSSPGRALEILLAHAAVYALLGLKREPPAIYKGKFGPRILLKAFRALHDMHA